MGRRARTDRFEDMLFDSVCSLWELQLVVKLVVKISERWSKAALTPFTVIKPPRKITLSFNIHETVRLSSYSTKRSKIIGYS